MRNAARRNEQARFTLRIEVTGGRPIAPPSPDFADGLSVGQTSSKWPASHRAIP